MSQVLKQLYASAGGVIHHTLEIKHPAFAVENHPPGRILFCQGFDDLTAMTEEQESVTFKASGFGVSLPNRTLKGQQNLNFQIDNVTGEALHALNAAVESGGKIHVIYRVYADLDLSEPGAAPYKMVAVSAKVTSSSIQVVASFNDLVNRGWPRRRYTPSFAPGLKYFG